MCPVSWCDRWLSFLCAHPISSRQLLSKMSVWCQRDLKTIPGSHLAAFLNLLLLFWACPPLTKVLTYGAPNNAHSVAFQIMMSNPWGLFHRESAWKSWCWSSQGDSSGLTFFSCFLFWSLFTWGLRKVWFPQGCFKIVFLCDKTSVWCCIKILMCLCVCLCEKGHIHGGWRANVCMQEPMEATKWCWISWNWNYRWLLATLWGLGTESGFSARALSALDYWGISLAPNSKQLPRPTFSGSQIVIYRRSSLGKEDFHCNILLYVKCILIGLYLLLFKKTALQ